MNNAEKAKKIIENAKKNNIKRVDLSDLGLSKIPEELLSMNFEEVNLSNNDIKIIDRDILENTYIKNIYFENNPITNIPDEILSHSIKTKSLKIYIDEINKQKHRQQELIDEYNLIKKKLQSKKILKEIRSEIKDSDFDQIEILRETLLEYEKNRIKTKNQYTKEVLKLFKDVNKIADEAKEVEDGYLCELKLLLVGEGRVGKTSISKTLSLEGYKLEKENSTEGIYINNWTIPKEKINTQKDLLVNIWDFGGQEIYHSTHQFFLTKRSIYLLVTESRKEDRFEDFYYWLNIIKLLSNDSPIIIVLNKCDQPTKDLPIHEYQSMFSNIIDYQKISCKEGFEDTIKNLYSSIIHAIKNKNYFPHLGTPLPNVWVKIREEISILRLNNNEFISKKQYLDLCKKYKINEEDALNLSEFFHDIGVFLHFQDDIFLAETIFLDHEWVTESVYKILDNKNIINNKGFFQNDDLDRIWDNQKFNEKKYELLSLMKNPKFEICYEVEQGNFLAPQLLSSKPIDGIENFEDGTKFNFKYSFMPKGILSRLIVKLHPYIYNNSFWKYGVILEYEGTKSLIKEDIFSNKIIISILGSNPQNILAIIRKSIFEVHRNFEQIDFVEQVQCCCNLCRNSKEPYYHNFKDIIRFKYKLNKRHKECNLSGENVSIEELIDNSVGNNDLSQHYYAQKIIKENGEIHMKNNNPWISGSFYLFCFLTIFAGIAFFQSIVPWYIIPISLFSGIIIIILIGMLQLRNDEKITDSSFKSIILKILKDIPLLRKFIKEKD